MISLKNYTKTWAYIYIFIDLPIYGGNAPSFVEGNSPDTCNIGDQVANELAGVNVPELKTTFRSRNNFVFIVLKTSDGSLMAR
jgi:hypothetical protein